MLNTNNFLQFFDPDDIGEFTNDGDFDNGNVATASPDYWTKNDVSPIGDNSQEFVWISTTDSYMDSASFTNEWTTGLSQLRQFKPNTVYHFDLRMFGTNGQGDHEVYFILINSSTDYEIAKQLTMVENTFYYNQFHIMPSKPYSRLLIVANNPNGVGFSIYRCIVKELSQCFYSLPLVRDDALYFWINASLDNTVDVFTQLKIGLWNDSLGMYLPDVATLTKVSISGDIYQMYFTWTVPTLPSGNFRFVIYDDSNVYTQELYISNSFTYTTSKNYTAFVKYKSVANILNFYYASAPTIYNQCRIDLWKGLPTYPKQKDGYQTYEGSFIAVKTSRQKLREFQTRFFNEIAHEGFDAMLMHDEIYIDDIEYILPEGQNYDISWSEDDGNRIGTGIVNLEEVSYSTSISQC